MIKFFARLRRRKGFTLTEMIVVTAIIGIIMASVVAFASPMRDSIKNTEARADAITINEVIGKYIEHNLAYACKLDAYVGYTYENNVSEILNTYNASGSDGYKDSVGVTGTSVRLFVAHFDNSGEKGTMKFYDVKLDSSGLPSLATLQSKGQVFTDDFFGNYQYFLTIDDDDLGKNTNSRTKKAYMNLRLESYNFGIDTSEDMTAGMITNYYKHVMSNGTDGSDDFAAAAVSYDKTGTENISFTLENIKSTDISTIKTNTSGDKQYYSNGAPIWETYSSASGAKIHRPTVDATSGTDLVILYKVKKY